MSPEDAKRKFNIDVKFKKYINKKSAEELYKVGYKYCPKCTDIKKFHKFSKNGYTKSGYASICVKCCDIFRKEKGYKNKYEGYTKRHKDYARKNYLKNKEKVDSKNKEWADKNPHKRVQYANKRRAAKVNATPSWSEDNKISVIYEKAKWLESLTGLTYHVDHVIPLQGKNVCGLHVWANLQILEKKINIAKSNKLQGAL
jgi:hypothetical protein